MVTTRLEAIHIMSIILNYMTPKVAKMMLADLDFEVAEHTDNESLKNSIKMVDKYLNEK
jgi:hypothetical protein|tara:strand:- start:266 stop:442 length:177 start_codon:yes stop_codon:yes gene_type:complete